MKRKNLLALLFALVFVLTSVLPAFAEEGELPSTLEQEETVQPPEETVPAPAPDESLEPAPEPDPEPVPEPEPAPGEEPPAIPVDPADGEDVPPASEDEAPQAPGEEENPGEGEDEDFNDPQDPADGEVPGEDGEPEEEHPDDPGEEEQESEPDSEEEELIIDVLVPDSGQVIINPYRMKVATSTGESTEQIVHEPQALVNLSGVPVQVDVQAIGTLAGGSEAFFVAAPPSEGAEEKEIFMYLEFQQFPDQWNGWYGDFDNQLLITSWGESKTNVLTLFPGGAGWYRLSGTMTDFPSVMWEEEDAPSVTLVFSFSAVPEVPEMQEYPVFPEVQEFSEMPEFPEFSEPAEFWETSDMGI